MESSLPFDLVNTVHDEDGDPGPTTLVEVGTCYSSVTSVPGPPRIPALERAAAAPGAARPTEQEIARRGWSIPLTLPNPSIFATTRSSRRPTVRAPHARPSTQPTVPPDWLP